MKIPCKYCKTKVDRVNNRNPKGTVCFDCKRRKQKERTLARKLGKSPIKAD